MVGEQNSMQRVFGGSHLYACVSVGALVAMMPTQAWAQCGDPQDGKVICTGDQDGGYVVSRSNLVVDVQTDTRITNTDTAALTVSMPVSDDRPGRNTRIVVDGTVSASNAAGISLTPGGAPDGSYDFFGSYADITVGQTGSVGGTYGILMAPTPGNAYGGVSLSLYNSGQIMGTSGYSVYDTQSGYSNSRIYNATTGTMNAIASGGNITNDGTINGGSLSAIAPGASASYGASAIYNGGTITSSSAAGTIFKASGTISNSGVITNTGTGRAIDGGNTLTLSNLAGGTISAAADSVFSTSLSFVTINNSGTIANIGSGSVLVMGQGFLDVANNAVGVISAQPGQAALRSDGRINLFNAGTIVGNVVSGVYDSRINSTLGTITGDVTFGSGNDTLVATLRDGALYTGISGAIDGGMGVNVLALQPDKDVTLSSALLLPINFTKLDFAPNAGTTLTLANTYLAGTPVYFDGTGTLVNQTTISGTGTVLGHLNGYSGGGYLVNEGRISSITGVDDFAVDLNGVAIDNKGGSGPTATASTPLPMGFPTVVGSLPPVRRHKCIPWAHSPTAA